MAKAIKDDINIFAKRLNELIKERKLIHEDIAQGIGVTRQGVGKWVSGDSVPDVLTVAKLAKFFNVSVDYLAGNSPDDVRTADMDIQAICNLTGLSEKSISCIFTRYTGEIFSPKYSECNKYVLDTILSSDHFWNITFFYATLMLNNELSENECKKILEKFSHTKLTPEALESPELQCVREIYNAIDIARYTVIREIEKISDLFDIRVNPSFDQLLNQKK